VISSIDQVALCPEVFGRRPESRLNAVAEEPYQYRGLGIGHGFKDGNNAGHKHRIIKTADGDHIDATIYPCAAYQALKER